MTPTISVLGLANLAPFVTAPLAQQTDVATPVAPTETKPANPLNSSQNYGVGMIRDIISTPGEVKTGIIDAGKVLAWYVGFIVLFILLIYVLVTGGTPVELVQKYTRRS